MSNRLNLRRAGRQRLPKTDNDLHLIKCCIGDLNQRLEHTEQFIKIAAEASLMHQIAEAIEEARQSPMWMH